MLNCMAWKLVENHESKNKGWKSPSSAEITGAASSPANSALSTSSPSGSELANVGYKQGMNVLAGVCHYACKGEVEAYAFFERLITVEVPGYFRGTLEGVHRGCDLVGEILSVCDPKLATFFAEKGWAPGVYAFQHVLTLSASTPPLPEVLKLWDFLFAAGPHMNLVCIVAQLMLIKDQLLAGMPLVALCLDSSGEADVSQTKRLSSQDAEPRSRENQDAGHPPCRRTTGRALRAHCQSRKVRIRLKTSPS